MQVKCLKTSKLGWVREGEVYEAVPRAEGLMVRTRENGPIWYPSEDFEAVPAAPTIAATSIAEAVDAPQGVKLDTGKPPLDLIDPEFELEVAKVLGAGAAKYAVDNWKKGMSLAKVLAGVRRHVNAIQRGEYLDPEFGLPHAAHAACGLMFAQYFIRNGMLNVPDDRWQKREVTP